MGERVQTGAIIYTVQEAEWKDQLSVGAETRTPKNRFLLIRLSITNSGPDASLPLLSLEDEKHQSYAELTETAGLEDWLGLLRTIPSVGTDQGWILFDVPPATYRLRVTNGGDPEQEKVAMVEIPYRVSPPQGQ